MMWLITYALPALFGIFTKKYVKWKFVYIHLLLLVSIIASGQFIVFPWSFSWFIVLAFVVSILLFKHVWYAISAIIQEACLLSALILAPMYSVIIVFLYAFSHDSVKMRLVTFVWGLVSCMLFLCLGTIVWSITLHILLGSLLLHRRVNNK